MNAVSQQQVLIDGSRLIIESMVKSGADVYIGYPITPANLLYSYGQARFPTFLAAPDEITAFQWAAGFSATGKLPVTGTSFPGFALMLESLNMAFMMELPMVVILSQRMGPSTGSATTGAQGDLLLVRSAISGGYPLPVFCPSDFQDCWDLAAKSVETALALRTPVVLLTSKELIMTKQSFDLSQLGELPALRWPEYSGNGTYQPYAAEVSQPPTFLPVGNNRQQVRLNASTHGNAGLIQKNTPEALANTKRLLEKTMQRLDEYGIYDYDSQADASVLLVTYGISTGATKQALTQLRSAGKKVSFLCVKTLLPIAPAILEIIDSYKKCIFVEENLTGLFSEMLNGLRSNSQVRKVNKIGHMITPAEIEKEVEECL